MDYNIFFDAAGKWGLGIVLALILVFMFRRFLNRVMDSMSEERNNYMGLISKQGDTIDNRISHVTTSVTDLSDKVHEVNVSLGEQKECLNQGFTRVVDAIRSQTEILSKNTKV